ncbi:protein kinase domain-containing protein [Cryptosporidium andersoni]|uniref:Protein kinase domain-containing protein n=1 Tax=Cryptosporidium andersoni TaxID=117008 RepID=A0A1J4MSQ5_9CRYT|nr:protein kinase domain-containing protein [Cryptosporidium andersoni]
MKLDDLCIINGEYKLLYILGRGAYGTVYKAVKIDNKEPKITSNREDINNLNYNLRSNNKYISKKEYTYELSIPKYYAIKVFDKKLTNKGIHPSILREIGLLKELHEYNFDGIIRLEQIVVCDQRICAVYEYGGSTLQSYIEKNANNLNLIDGIYISYQIIKSVNFLHSIGIVHRDLKPENILFNENTKIVKIADFGLARTIRNNNGINFTIDVATLYYKPPELLSFNTNNKLICPYAVDCWTIGVIILELFTILCKNFRNKSYLGYNTRSNLSKANTNTWLPIFFGGNEVAVCNEIYKLLNISCQFHILKDTLKPLKDRFPDIFNLIFQLLQIEPKERCNCEYAKFVVEKIVNNLTS